MTCLCDQLLIKSLRPKDSNGLPGTNTFNTCPYSLLLDRKNILCGPKWGRTWKPGFSLSGLYPVHIFSCCFFPVSFAVNLTIHIKRLLSLVSPCSESTNWKVVFGPLKYSTFKIRPSFNSFIPSLLFPLWSKLPSSFIWDNAILIPPLLPYSLF